MNRFKKTFISIFIIYVLLIGISITVSKYVLVSSYSVNVVFEIDTQNTVIEDNIYDDSNTIIKEDETNAKDKDLEEIESTIL